jgi:hypothetical protein
VLAVGTAHRPRKGLAGRLLDNGIFPVVRAFLNSGKEKFNCLITRDVSENQDFLSSTLVLQEGRKG